MEVFWDGDHIVIESEAGEILWVERAELGKLIIRLASLRSHDLRLRTAPEWQKEMAR